MHSAVDTITNSSTEIFMCDTNLGLDMVKKILIDTLKEYNEHHGCNLTFKRVFKEPYIATEKDCELWDFKVGQLIIEGKSDQSIPNDLMDAVQEMFNAQRDKY